MENRRLRNEQERLRRSGPGRSSFGVELRRRRMAAAMSLAELGRATFYTKGYLSKIENGEKPASVDLARRCDAVLQADGELTRLASPATEPSGSTEQDRPGAPDCHHGHECHGGHDCHGEPGGPGRPGGAGSGTTPGRALEIGECGEAPGATPIVPDPALVNVNLLAGQPQLLPVLTTIFEQYRLMGHQGSPGCVLPALTAQTGTLLALLQGTMDPTLRRSLALLAARHVEYAGWMEQEAGRVRSAVARTEQAVRLAESAGDPDFARYALVRYAELALYRDDAADTVALSRRARASAVGNPSIRALALEREAQGHAIFGDHRACLAALDAAAELRAASFTADRGTAPVFGTTCIVDSVAMATGWSLYDLGRPAAAAAVLDREVPRIPVGAVRSRVRYGVRRALSHAAAGELDHACALTVDLLPAARQTDSATVRTDLRRLMHCLARWHNHPPVRHLFPDLTAALNQLPG